MTVVMPRDEARIVAVMRRSALVRALEGILDTVTVAWRHSIVGALTRSGAAEMKEQPVAVQARVAGAVMTVASATALALQQSASPPEPLIWIVPATCLIIGLCLVVACREGPAR
jgi:hypothetical protein